MKDYLILDSCCRWALHIIDQKPRIAKEKLNYKDEYYKKWIESVRSNIQDQAEESTIGADPQEFKKQFLDEINEIRDDFIKVMQGSEFAVWEFITSEAEQKK
jgi:hypothetical protein